MVSHLVADQRLLGAAARLGVLHRGTVSPETVLQVLTDSYDRLERGASVRRHLPLLAERFAAQRLDALAHARTPGPGGQVRVLFVCTANAGRSQLAAALLNHQAAGTATALSAGTCPAADLDATVVQVLQEIGVDPGEPFPKPVTGEIVAAADIVITLGCRDACPVVPGRQYADWPLEDPAGAPLTAVRAIRDQLQAHVRDLLDSPAITR